MITQVSICEDCYNTAVEILGEETARYYVVLCRRYAEFGPVPTIFSGKGKKMVDVLEKNRYVTTSEIDKDGKFLKLKPNGSSFDEEEKKLILCPVCVGV